MNRNKARMDDQKCSVYVEHLVCICIDSIRIDDRITAAAWCIEL